MSWKVRPAGAARAVENLTLAQVVGGLDEGSWDANDLALGPGDKQWIAIGDHPQLADTAAILDPRLPEPGDEEERLDMNPLIDVCLVLLVFFMIGVSYLNLPKGHRVPKNKPDNPGALRPVTPEQVKNLMIVVTAKPGTTAGGPPVIMVEQEQVDELGIERALLQFVQATRKTEVLIDAKDVSWGTVVKIIDAAAGAGITNVHFQAGSVGR